MTCRREAGSIEDILFDALDVLSPADILRFTGVRRSVFEKASNPNLDRALVFKYVAGLDAALMHNGFDPWFANYLKQETERKLVEAGSPRQSKSLVMRVMRVTGDTGKLADVIEKVAGGKVARADVEDLRRVVADEISELMGIDAALKNQSGLN
jgi:hypothetical protein